MLVHQRRSADGLPHRIPDESEASRVAGGRRDADTHTRRRGLRRYARLAPRFHWVVEVLRISGDPMQVDPERHYRQWFTEEPMQAGN